MGKNKDNRGGKGKPPAVLQPPKVLAWSPPPGPAAKLLWAAENNSISVYAPKTGGYKTRKGAH